MLISLISIRSHMSKDKTETIYTNQEEKTNHNKKHNKNQDPPTFILHVL